jgi:tetratricopeptide (TPR) repeat protein
MGSRVTRNRTWGAFRVAFVLCSLCALPSGSAFAAGPPKDPPAAADKARAADLVKKSVEAYRQGDFKQAIALLDEAYALDPQPVLTYNRARAQEGLGNVDEAISGYEQFLAQEPNAPDRGAIEQRLVTLRRQREERTALEKERDARRDSAEPAPVAAPVPNTHSQPGPAAHPDVVSPPSRHSVFPYVVAGVGVVGLAVGGVLGLSALSRKDEAASEPVQRSAIDLKDEADGLATASTAAFIVGGVLVAAGATWWVLDRGLFKAQPGGVSLRVRLAPGLVGLGGVLP